MSSLKDLVPPLELCKKIPDGEFGDSVHWYRWSWVDQKYLLDAGKPDVRLYREPCPCGMKYLYPAPTLQEILEELPPYGKNEQILACCVPDWADFDARVFGEHWRVGYTGDCSINDKNAATAALKLWLKMSDLSETSDQSNKQKDQSK